MEIPNQFHSKIIYFNQSQGLEITAPANSSPPNKKKKSIFHSQFLNEYQNFNSIGFFDSKIFIYFNFSVTVLFYDNQTDEICFFQKITTEQKIDLFFNNNKYIVLTNIETNDLIPKFECFVINEEQSKYQLVKEGIFIDRPIKTICFSNNLLLISDENNNLVSLDLKERFSKKFLALKKYYAIKLICPSKFKPNNFFIAVDKIDNIVKIVNVNYDYLNGLSVAHSISIKNNVDQNILDVDFYGDENLIFVLFPDQALIYKKGKDKFAFQARISFLDILGDLNNNINQKETRIKKILNFDDKKLIFLTENNQFVYFEINENFSFLFKERFVFNSIEPSEIFLSSATNDPKYIIRSIESENKSRVLFLEALQLNPEEAFVKYLKDGNDDKLDKLIEDFKFDQEFIYKTKWEVGEKNIQNIRIYLSKLEDFNYVEKQIENLGQKTLEGLKSIYEIALGILIRKVKNEHEVVVNLSQLIRINYKIKMANLYESFNQNEYFDYLDYLSFSERNVLDVFIEMVENSKFLSVKKIMNEFSRLIFSNFWTIIDKLSNFTKEPLKYSALFPKLFPEGEEDDENILPFNIFHFSKRIDDDGIQIFDDLLENFPNLRDKNLSLIKSEISNIFNDLDIFTLICQPKAIMKEINSEKTFHVLLKLLHESTGNLDKCISLLKIGFDHSFQRLNKLIVTYSFYSILLYDNEEIELNFEEFSKLRLRTQFQTVLEKNLVGMKFIKLLKNFFKGLYEMYLNLEKYQKHLSFFCASKVCSIKHFHEIIKLIFSKSFDEIAFIKDERTFLNEVVFDYLDSRVTFEDHEYFSGILKLIVSKKNDLSEEINKKLEYYFSLAEICQILFSFGMNLELNFLKKFDSNTERVETSYKIYNEILESFILKRKKSSYVFIEEEQYSLNELSTILKILFLLRNRLSPFISDSQIYQTICKKLLENANFSILCELIDKEKIIKVMSPEVFELIISEILEKTYKTAANISQIEGFVKKSLEFISWNSPIKKAEKNFLKMAFTLENFKVNISLKELRNGNRKFLIDRILNDLKENLKAFPFFKFYKQLLKFDGELKKLNKDDSMEYLKEFGLKLLKQNELNKAVEILNYLIENNFYVGTYQICYEIIIFHSESISQMDLEHYQSLALLHCNENEKLIQILRLFDYQKNMTDIFLDKIVLTDLSLVDKKCDFFQNDKLLTKNIKKLIKQIKDQSNPPSNFDNFFLDLTVNPDRAFFILSLDIFEGNTFENLEKIMIHLFKSNIFDKLLILSSFLKMLIFNLKNSELDYEFFSVKNILDENDLKIVDSSNPKLLQLFIRIKKMYLLYQKISNLSQYLKDEKEVEKFLFEETYRNQKLISIIMEAGDSKIYEDFSSIVELSHIKPSDLIIVRLVANINQRNKLEIQSNLRKLSNLSSDCDTYLTKIFEKINGGISIISFFFNFFLDESVIVFPQWENNIDRKNLQYLRSFLEVTRKIEISVKSGLIDPNWILGGTKEYEKSEIKQHLLSIQGYLDESNFIVIGKYFARLFQESYLEEKISLMLFKKKMEFNINNGNYEEDGMLLILLKKFRGEKVVNKLYEYLENYENANHANKFAYIKKIHKLMQGRIKGLRIYEKLKERILFFDKIITFKLGLMEINKSANLKLSISENIREFLKENIINTNSVFEILNRIFSQKSELSILTKIWNLLDISIIKEYFIFTFENIIFDLKEIKNSNSDSLFKFSKSSFPPRDMINELEKNRTIKKIMLNLSNLNFILNNDSFQKESEEYINNYIISLHQSEHSEILLAFLSILNKTLTIKNVEIKEIFDLLVINLSTRIQLEANFSEDLKEFLKLQSCLSNNYLIDNIFEMLINFCSSLYEYAFMLHLINFIDKRQKKNDLYQKFISKLITLDPISLLELINIGLLDDFFNNSKSESDQYPFEHVDNLYKKLIIIYIKKKITLDEQSANQIISLIFSSDSTEFISLCKEESSKNMIHKFVLSFNMLGRMFDHEMQNEFVENLFLLCKKNFIDSKIKLFNQDRLFEICEFRKTEELQIFGKFEKFKERFLFGKCIFELLVQNILILIDKNEYYDAAKLNYQWHNNEGKYSIDIIIDDLKNFLNSIEGNESVKIFLNEENKKMLRMQIEKLKRIKE